MIIKNYIENYPKYNKEDKDFAKYVLDLFNDTSVKLNRDYYMDVRLSILNNNDPVDNNRTYKGYQAIALRKKRNSAYLIAYDSKKTAIGDIYTIEDKNTRTSNKKRYSQKNEGEYFTFNEKREYDGQLLVDRLPSHNDSIETIYRKLGLNKDYYDIKKFNVSRWNSPRKEDEEPLELYAIKFEATPNIKKETLITTDYTTLFNNLDIPPLPKITKINQKKDENLLLEIPIMDLHLNKDSSFYITKERYNSEIAKNRFEKVIDEIIKTYSHIDNFILHIGQDFFNIDNLQKTTTHGTPQDTDITFEKMFVLGIEIVTNAIKKLAKIGNVKIIHVEGNHDTISCWMMLNVIKAHFKDNKHISFDIEKIKRKYFRWGKNLIGYSHGDTEGKRLEGLMQQEAKHEWALSNHREWHLGHLHTKIVEEKNGIIFRRLSAISGTDRWHFNKGYSSNQGVELFLWHKDKGLDHIKYILFN